MRALIQRLFGPPPSTSKDDAIQRLKIVLMHDQCDLSPAQLESMKDEIVAVMRRYVEVDQAGVEFRLSKSDEGVALVSSVPVRRVTTRPAPSPS
jgi:cell division topological specificity factor